MLYQNIEFRVCTDARAYENTLRVLLEEKADLGELLELLLSSAQKHFDRWINNKEALYFKRINAIEQLDKCAAAINAMVQLYPTKIAQVEVGRGYPFQNSERERATAATMKKILTFMAQVVHKLQALKEKDREFHKYILQYAMYICEQAQSIVSTHHWDHPEQLRWLNIATRVQRRMAAFWSEAAEQSEQYAKRVKTLRAGVDMVVSHLSANDEVLDSQSINLVPGHNPIFKLNEGEKLHFEVASGFKETGDPFEDRPVLTEFTVGLKPWPADSKTIITNIGHLCIRVHGDRQDGNYFATGGE